MSKALRASQAALIARLQAWGYDVNAVKPVAKVMEKMDTATLALVTRLVHDLTHINDSSHDLTNQVNNLTDDLDHENQLVERFRVENELLQRENSELHSQVEMKNTPEAGTDGRVSPSALCGEEQVQQWRAQSMHQLQELENMNQALRSTLHLQSRAPTIVDQQVAGHMTLSEPLEPSTEPTSPPAPKAKQNCLENQKELELLRVAETRWQRAEEELEKLKERYAFLENKFVVAQEWNSSMEKEMQELQTANKTSSFAQTKESTTATKIIHALTSDLESLVSELASLQQVYEKGKEDQKIALAKATSDFPDKRIEVISRHQIEYVLWGGDVEQKLRSIKGFIHNLDQKEEELVKEINGLDAQLEAVAAERSELWKLMADLRKDLPPGIMALATVPEEVGIKEGNRSSLAHAAAQDKDKTSPEFYERISKTLFSIKEYKAMERSLTKVAGLKAKLDDLRTTMGEQEATIVALRVELMKKNGQLGFINDEKVVGEEALEASQQECSQLALLIREIDGSMAQLTSALATRTLERDRETEARMVAEQEVHMKCNNLVGEFEDLQLKYTRLQNDHAGCGRHQEDSTLKITETSSQLQLYIQRLETAERDVDQLKTLITQLDATREELVGKLKTTLGNQQLAEQRVVAMDMEVRRLSEDCGERTCEINHVCGLLDALVKERDHLQAEVNGQREKIVQMSDENGHLHSEIHFIKRNLQTAEHRLQSGQSLLQQAESESASLKSQLSMEEDARKTLDDRLSAKISELHTAEDLLQSSNCDVQMLKAEMLQVVAERENVLNELRNMNSKLQYCEQMLGVKEKEEEEIMKLYRNLSGENQQLKLQAVEGDNQLQNQRYQIQSLEEAFQRTQAQKKTVEDENQRLTCDLKALERQGDLMTRSLAQQSGLLNDYQIEKAALVTQLSVMKVAAADLESSSSAARRDVTASETKHQYMSGMLVESQKEREAMTTRYRLEHERVRELEQLLACVRAQEQQMELESKDSGTKIAMMRDRICSLEEQVQTLQITRDAQNQEIMRLQSCLNAQETEERLGGRPIVPSPALSNQSMEMKLHHTAADVAGSKAKVRELEMKNFSLTGDLTKTATLYKECFSQLQKSETQNMELRREYEHAVSLLSKVDGDRMQLQRKCLELVAAADRTHQQKMGTPTHRDSKYLDVPGDIEALQAVAPVQKECHRLKQESTPIPASSESSRVAGSRQ